MKVLFIWEGREQLPQFRIDAIKKTVSLYPDADFYWVTNGAVPFPNMKRIEWNDQLEKMQKFYGIDHCPDRWRDWMIFSDWFRFFFLITNPNTLYLDTDCGLVEPFDFESQKVLIYPFEEICLMYNPKGNPMRCIMPALKRSIARGKFTTLLHFYFHVKNIPGAQMLPGFYYRHKWKQSKK